MPNLFRSLAVLFLLVLNTGCATPHTEHFSESFYTYKNNEGKKYFSFTLKLDGMNAVRESNPFDPQGRRVQTENGKARRQRKEDPIAMPEDPMDALVSLKFRMEEMAHEKLEARLAATNYCADKVEYESEDYEKFRYKIRGFCSE